MTDNMDGTVSIDGRNFDRARDAEAYLEGVERKTPLNQSRISQ